MNQCTERLYNGIVKENPTFVQMLGMCPTLAVTSAAINGAGMGLATTCILVMSNFVISLLRKVIPDKVRIPSFIVIIASFVTVIQFLMEAYLPSLNASLGIYIPLIVVNCIILGRAESYASKNKPLPSIFDGLGMGLGFTIGLTVIGAFRELIGKGCIFGYQILGDGNLLQGQSGIVKAIGNVFGLYTPITIFVLAPGAFFVLAFLVAFINKRNAKKAAVAATGETVVSSCKPESCAGCSNTMCAGKFLAAAPIEQAEASASKTETADGQKEKAIGMKTENVIPSENQVNEKAAFKTKEEAVTEPVEEAAAEPKEEAVTEQAEEAAAEPGEEAVTEQAEEAAAEPKEEAVAEEAAALTAEQEEEPEDGIQIKAIMNKIERYHKLNPGKVKPIELPEPEPPQTEETKTEEPVTVDSGNNDAKQEDINHPNNHSAKKNKRVRKRKKGGKR